MGPMLWGPNNTAQSLEGGVKLGQLGSTILSGTVDPSAVATIGNIGSLYLNTSNGNVYRKTDNGSSTNWVALPTSGGGSAFDPSTTFSLFDDFSTAYYASSGQVFGNYPWASVVTATGVLTGQGATIPSTAANPGILELSTGTNSAGGAGLFSAAFGGTTTSAFLTGGGAMTYEALVNYPVLSNGTDNAQLDVGFLDSPGWSASTNRWCIQYQKEGSAFWRLLTTAASTTTTVTSSVAATAGWHKIKMVMNAAGTSVEGFVDGVSLGTSITNIPTVKLPPMISIRKTLGTTAMYLGIDYIKIDKTFSSAR